jgi:hypothetical protein
MEEKLPVGFLNSSQKPAELVKELGFLLGMAKGDFFRRLPFRQMENLRWLFPFIEELIKRNLKGSGKLLQGFG